MSLFISGARVFTPGRNLGVVSLRVEGNQIAAVGSEISASSGDKVIDASGLVLLPGFVDIHSHGRGGADFCDATDEAFRTIGVGKLSDGVTSFLATGLTRPEENLAEMCRCVERYKEKGEGAKCLGVHLEGPFFNPATFETIAFGS